MSYVAAGTAAAGLASAYMSKDAGSDAAKAQMKYYAKYVLPKIQQEQRQQQMLNTQSLGTYTSSGNTAMNMLTGLGTGQFGLTDQDQARIAELQAMDYSPSTAGKGRRRREEDSITNQQRQANEQELRSLLDKQQMGEQYGEGGLGTFLQGHPLYEAMQNIGGNALDEQYAAAFGGMAPSTFMGEQKGRMGSQNLLNTFGAIQQPLATVAGLGGNALGQQTAANTGLTQTTMQGMNQFGNQNAITAGQNPGWSSVVDAAGQVPMNYMANKYMADWFGKKSGAIGGSAGQNSLGTGGMGLGGITAIPPTYT